MTETHAAIDFVGLTTEIVSAYVSHNSVPPGDLGQLIDLVHASLAGIVEGQGGARADAVKLGPPEPAIPVKKSITPDYLVCLEDGRTFKSLKRHLRSKYNLSPEQYRARWDLPSDYPMVAPNYAKARSELARAIGLGLPRQSGYDKAA